jgi:NAD(P)H dehydrogenase (quinone)
MVKAKILVTGAGGKTGFAVVSRLREEDWPVRALLRTNDRRRAALERLGAEVVIADMFDVEQLTTAASGTERAYFVPPYHPNMLHSAVAFARAARAAKIDVIVGMSQWLASPSHPSLPTRQHWLADEMFSDLPGVGYIKLYPGYFADNYLRFVDSASLLGIIPNLTGDSRNAPPSNEDIGRVAAALLMRPDAHVGKSYRPTGPKLISTHDVAEVFTRVLGRKVRAMPVPLWLLAKATRRQISAFDYAGLVKYLTDHQQGAFELGAPNRVVLEVTGRPAEDLEVTVRRYAALPQARRTFGRIARAWFDFMRTPFLPGHDVAAYERSLAIARPAKARFAMEDEAWRSERGEATHGA